MFVLCALPFVLSLTGIDFGLPSGAIATSHTTHTILEWSAFCTTLLTVFLAFVHFSFTRNGTVLIIGAALGCAGIMDATHILMSEGLLAKAADPRNVMSFTWTVGRFFTALAMIVGAWACLLSRPPIWKSRFHLTLMHSVAVGALVLGFVHLYVASRQFPRTILSEVVVSRPYEVTSIVILFLASAFFYRRLGSQTPSAFTYAMVISTLPHIAAQLYMTFASKVAFDTPFYLAHGLKIFAYLIPFGGLALDHVRACREGVTVVKQLQATHATVIERSFELERRNADLEQRNAELDEFNYMAGHDLQEPIRKVIAFSHHLRQDIGPLLTPRAEQDVHYIVDAATRMQALIQALLTFSQTGKMALKHEWISPDDCVDHVLNVLALRIKETQATIIRDPLPAIWGDPILISLIYQNLIDNALKFVDHHPPLIRLTSEQGPDHPILGVQDHGIGLKPEDVEHIFTPFNRLQRDAGYTGTGIGLAICRKAIERHTGSIWVESEPGEGAHFKFTLGSPEQGNGTHDAH
ncbi:MAG: ATP-binding protein [Candidatus Tectomicrobia bacterium]